MRSETVRRLPIVIVIALAAIVALVLGNPDPEPAPAVSPVDAASRLAPAESQVTPWFCPGFPASLALDGQTLSLSNLGSEPADTLVTVFPDDGSAPIGQSIAVAPGEVNVLSRATLGAPGGVVVEAFSSDVVVENGIEATDQFALGPCATSATRDWYFAAGTTGNFEGTTGRPVEAWLALFNPFGTDARTRVTLRTNDAVPAELPTVDVPRRSRVLVPIHEQAVRKAQVSIEVHATTGRVIASQTMVFGTDSGYTAVSSSLGALAPTSSWTFADGSSTTGSRTVVALVNPGLVDTEVDVIVSAAAAPLTVAVARDKVVWVQIGGCGDPPAEGCVVVPADTAYTVTAVSDEDTPIVAEQLAFYGQTSTGEGVAELAGTPFGPRGAVFGRAGIGEGRTAVLAIANPGATAVTATLSVVRAAAPPPAPVDIEIGPGQQVTTDLGALLGGLEGALVVDATGPVVVNRSVYSEGEITRANAIVKPE